MSASSRGTKTLRFRRSNAEPKLSGDKAPRLLGRSVPKMAARFAIAKEKARGLRQVVAKALTSPVVDNPVDQLFLGHLKTKIEQTMMHASTFRGSLAWAPVSQDRLGVLAVNHGAVSQTLEALETQVAGIDAVTRNANFLRERPVSDPARQRSMATLRRVVRTLPKLDPRNATDVMFVRDLLKLARVHEPNNIELLSAAGELTRAGQDLMSGVIATAPVALAHLERFRPQIDRALATP